MLHVNTVVRNLSRKTRKQAEAGVGRGEVAVLAQGADQPDISS